MCGIAGFSGGFEADLLEAMGAAIAHRGPDDAGTCFLPESRVGLAHRRLSIIDLSAAGHQPMWDASGSVAITYNGEIYNYRELRKELEADGFTFRSQSDTEVLLQMYLRHGPDLLPRLNGIFAFAIWDARSQRLFLARDHMGVKPLYHANTPRGFLFASELKALLHAPDVSRELDPLAIGYYLHYCWSPSPHTMLRNVAKLEPGCAMLVRDGRIERDWRYWELPYGAGSPELDVEEAAERVRLQVEASVRSQMVADVPVGAFLSGGLDSSSVVAFARQFADGQELRCFSIGFRDDVSRSEGMGEDLPYAERVAEHLGVRLDTVWVGPEMVEELPRVLFHMDEPQADPAPINALLICQLARQHGMKVLLSGAGGDDIFTGYRRHVALQMERLWSWLPRPARAMMAGAAGALPVRAPLARRARKALQFAHLESDERLASYFWWARPEILRETYGPKLREALASESIAAPLCGALGRLPPGVSELDRMLFLEGKFFLADHNLNYTDKTSMASGVEVRVPLIDPDLVTLAASLPVGLKQRGATGKWIFRKAMAPLLPAEVLQRSKAGFGAPLRHWLHGPLAPLLADVLSDRSMESRGVFDPAGVRHMVELDRSGREDATYPLFGLMCIELWCRMFVDPPTPTWSGLANSIRTARR